MSEKVSKTESGLSKKDQEALAMLTPGERIILERLQELHPSDEAFDLFHDFAGWGLLANPGLRARLCRAEKEGNPAICRGREATMNKKHPHISPWVSTLAPTSA